MIPSMRHVCLVSYCGYKRNSCAAREVGCVTIQNYNVFILKAVISSFGTKLDIQYPYI